MTRHQKRLLAKHAKHFQAMAQFIVDCSDSTLEILMQACLGASTTNCSWDTYAAAQYMKVEIQTELNARQRRALEVGAKDQVA